MKIMQQLLSKGLLLVIAFIVALAYFKRAELWPQWFAPQVKETHADTAPVPAPQASVPAPPPDGGVTPDTMAATSLPDAGNTAADAAPMPAENAGADANASTGAVNVPAQTLAETSSDHPAAPVESESPASANATGPSSAADASAMDAVTLLQQARSAYWAHDLDTAERLYRQLASVTPDDADPLGELGNLYYSEGRWNDAATAYADVVQRLLAQGDTERGEYVLTVIDGLDPVRAEKLRKELHLDGGT